MTEDCSNISIHCNKASLTADLRRNWRLELAAFLAAYLAYSCARWIVAGDPDTAQRHAHWIFHLEQTVGIAIEHSVQSYFDAPAAARVFSAVYLTAQFVVLPAALVWLYHHSPERRPIPRITQLNEACVR